ncbi:MAG: cell division protein SepF [Candidatus Sericytochromatia bacterium]
MSSLLEKFKNILGLNDEDLTEDEEHIEESSLTETETQINEELPIMQQEEKKKRVVRTNPTNTNIIDFSAPPSNEVVIVEPKSYDDAMKVVSLLKSKKSVIVNVLGSSLTSEDTDHILDFICGAVYAIEGNQKTVTKEGGVYLFTPGNVNINSMDSELPRSVDKSGNNLFLTINDITSKKSKVS